MDIKEQFEKATTDSKNLLAKPANETLLQLYALFKQSTEGDINTEAPANPFDFVAKAKHQAWEAIKGKTKVDAMSDYVALVNNLKA